MEQNGDVTFEEHLYWLIAVFGLLALAVFVTFSHPAIIG